MSRGKRQRKQQLVFHNAGGDRPILYLTTLSEPLIASNGTTLIPAGATVRDMLGREVAVLVRAQMEAGWHTATVDVSALPSGLYIYRLNLGGKVLNRALTVAR